MTNQEVQGTSPATKHALGSNSFAVAVCCVALNVIDGFDILVMAFAAPALKTAWTLSPQQMGLVFSAGIAGLMLGGLALAALADIFGRRRIVLLCLGIGAVGMLSCANSSELQTLIFFRFITGLGVGGMMPTINTVLAENFTGWKRSFAIVIQAAGYPLGGTIGGLIAMFFGDDLGWRGLLLLGGAASVAMLPAVFLWIPESAEQVLARRAMAPISRGTGSKDVRLYSRIGTAVSRWRGPRSRPGLHVARDRGTIAATVMICLALFLVQFSFYFLTSWTPSILATRGLDIATGISGAMFLNFGGIVGDFGFALLCAKWNLRPLGACAMVACFISVIALSISSRNDLVMLFALLVGCFLFSSMASLYAVAPGVFPPNVRATGTGLALSVGRIGGALGPWIGGIIIGGTDKLTSNALAAIAFPLLAAAAVMIRLKPTHNVQTAAVTP